ncbi:MAG: endonuclease/exonuclease/phosphatase family protein [Verrucomicrobiota bacterium]|nr:endonuclease/exonuclease/phosphatase family protein [Verrucomicrobiota bacterium]
MIFRFLGVCSLLALCSGAAETFTVATYNVENYFLSAFAKRKAKTEASRAKVVEIIASIKPDILALQEMGRKEALQELRQRLSNKGLNYSQTIFLEAADPAIHLGVLSRFPIVGNHSTTNVTYLLDGKRLQVRRGFVEIEIQVSADYKFTLFNGHLKSMRQVAHADQAEMRLEEARILRRLIEKRLEVNPNENILLMGDLNDASSRDPIKVLTGKGSAKLIDLRPSEKNDDRLGKKDGHLSRRVTWTHFYKTDDQFSRLDYIMASRGMVRELDSSYVYATTEWGEASDHRPVVARFVAKER